MSTSLTRHPEVQADVKAGLVVNGVMAEVKHVPRSIVVILLLLLISVLGGVLLLLDPQTSRPHELKAVGNRALEAARPLARHTGKQRVALTSRGAMREAS